MNFYAGSVKQKADPPSKPVIDRNPTREETLCYSRLSWGVKTFELAVKGRFSLLVRSWSL